MPTDERRDSLRTTHSTVASSESFNFAQAWTGASPNCWTRTSNARRPRTNEASEVWQCKPPERGTNPFHPPTVRPNVRPPAVIRIGYRPGDEAGLVSTPGPAPYRCLFGLSRRFNKDLFGRRPRRCLRSTWSSGEVTQIRSATPGMATVIRRSTCAAAEETVAEYEQIDLQAVGGVDETVRGVCLALRHPRGSSPAYAASASSGRGVHQPARLTRSRRHQPRSQVSVASFANDPNTVNDEGAMTDPSPGFPAGRDLGPHASDPPAGLTVEEA